MHINRAPTAGRVLELHYHPGEFNDARRPECAERNEFMWIGMERRDQPHTRFAVRQISGMLARRIVCTLKPGQTVTRGEKFGMIKLGSRTELILPAEPVDITVKRRRQTPALGSRYRRPLEVKPPRFSAFEKRKRDPIMKPIRAVAVLPTLFTLGNLICGFFRDRGPRSPSKASRSIRLNARADGQHQTDP